MSFQQKKRYVMPSGGRYFMKIGGLIPARGGSKGSAKRKIFEFYMETPFDCMDNRKGHAIRVVG